MNRKIKIILLLIGMILSLGAVLISIYSVRNYLINPEARNQTSPAIAEMPDAAEIYCKTLGYFIGVNESEEGEVGICIFPDNSECNKWSFYAGLCGQNWSYCNQMGYDIKTMEDCKDDYSPTYSICINKTNKLEVGLVSELINISEKINNPQA